MILFSLLLDIVSNGLSKQELSFPGNKYIFWTLFP